MSVTTPQPSGTSAAGEAPEAALGDVIGFMTDDKSNDWSSEIDALRRVEAEMAALRNELETYRANVGPVEKAVITSRYSRLGRFTAALLGSRLVYNGGDICADISTRWDQIGSPAIGGQDAAALSHWRAIADSEGVDYDADETIEEG